MKNPSSSQNSSSQEGKVLLDRYQLIKSIGKGGMGEVFLAFDRRCERQIALKQIRQELQDHSHVRRRFLKEARITSQLMHPAIIPIYSIHTQGTNVFYTMPFVEGETLKQIIRKTRQQEKNGETLCHVGGSIHALLRIFITICQAIAFAHTKGILHRDLKPENIIIGKFGEVFILDWGLAKLNRDEDEPLPSLSSSSEITRMGKVVGTIAYMAPERARGQCATKQTDVYALGAILYQLLTLRNPFSRGSLEEFRENMADEELVDPIHASPYRDISKVLSQITLKCLNPNPQERYQAVDHLIQDLENYIEGRSDWVHVAQLDSHERQDWEIRENILMTEPMILNHSNEESEWINLMISKQSFSGNVRIDFSICLHENSSGIGILFSVPESSERKSITDGYCLWLSHENENATKLLRSHVEVMQVPDVFLKKDQTYLVRIEKIEKSIHLYIDDVLQFSYIAHFPLIGTHVGLLSKDTDFVIDPIHIYVGNLNLMVNCLAIPDAFLARRDFSQALSEYRRIAYSFPDRAEGREAIFRSGLTLIEEAKTKDDEKEALFEMALHEFEKLHKTPGGPLEYLGKAVVYQEIGETEEEIKCFEIAYRRYPKHPLLPILQEQIISRLHEVSKKERILTYRFCLLAATHFSADTIDAHTSRLLSNLQKHSEPLPFIETPFFLEISESSLQHIALITAFWLNKPCIISEWLEEISKSSHFSPVEYANGCACLIELGAITEAKHHLDTWIRKVDTRDMMISGLELMIQSHSIPLDKVLSLLLSSCKNGLAYPLARTLLYILDRAIDTRCTHLMNVAKNSLGDLKISSEVCLQIHLKQIWAALLENDLSQVTSLFAHFTRDELLSESSSLHFLYGCYIAAKDGFEAAKAHFSQLLEPTYPRTWTLGSHAIKNDFLCTGWFENAFSYEKRQLYRQLSLFYHCLGEHELRDEFLRLSTSV